MFAQWIARLSVLILSLFSTVSFANNSTTVGQYQINHIAYNSTFLSGEMATAFGIKRAENAAVINISVQDMNNEGKGVEVTKIKGQVKNMFQQVKFIDFRKVPSGDAVYYLDEYRFGNEDRLTFSVDITLPGHSSPTTVKWQQTMYKQ